MDKLSEISLENTVTVKIDYQLNQELLVKNFGIIMDCLKDLKNTQDKHSADLSNMAGLKEMFDRFKEELRIKGEKEKENNNSDKNTQNNSNSNDHSGNIDKTVIESLQNEIDSLKNRMTKNEGSTHDNTKDINILLKDMKDAKEEIENLKKQLMNINSGRSNSQHGDRNLSKNENLSQDIINNLNQQAQEHEKSLQNLLKEMENMKNHIKSLEKDVENLKNIQQQALEDKKLEESTSNNGDSKLTGDFDQKMLSDLVKKVEFLTKKSENMQSQLLNNSRCINELNETTEKNGQEIDVLKDDVGGINSEIEKIKKILEELQKSLSSGNNKNGDEDRNEDNSQILSEIERLKEKYEKLLKMINSLKESKTSLEKLDKNENSNGSETDRFTNSNKNISKLPQDRSFRKRSDSIDMNGKIRELTERIKILEKMFGGSDDNPEKLPSIGWKRQNQTGYNGEKSHKKEISEMKNDLEIWIKSYLDNMGKNNGGSMTDLELKIQEMKNILLRKADHEGMKKGLAFLEGKITQLYLFLTEPESEDAMIVRKGFNCLSCSKKVETLRGKLGPRMNWDNLNTTHQNIHTPPKNGFPKYHDSNERESI